MCRGVDLGLTDRLSAPVYNTDAVRAVFTCFSYRHWDVIMPYLVWREGSSGVAAASRLQLAAAPGSDASPVMVSWCATSWSCISASKPLQSSYVPAHSSLNTASATHKQGPVGKDPSRFSTRSNWNREWCQPPYVTFTLVRTRCGKERLPSSTRSTCGDRCGRRPRTECTKWMFWGAILYTSSILQAEVLRAASWNSAEPPFRGN